MADKRYNQLSAMKQGANMHYYSHGNYIGCSTILVGNRFYKSEMLQVFINRNPNLQPKTKTKP